MYCFFDHKIKCKGEVENTADHWPDKTQNRDHKTMLYKRKDQITISSVLRSLLFLTPSSTPWTPTPSNPLMLAPSSPAASCSPCTKLFYLVTGSVRCISNWGDCESFWWPAVEVGMVSVPSYRVLLYHCIAVIVCLVFVTEARFLNLS